MHRGVPVTVIVTTKLAELERAAHAARDRGRTRPDCSEPGDHSGVHHAVDWADGGQTDADSLYFGCSPEHTEATCGHLTTTVTEEGRLGWRERTGPPQVNHFHHPEELFDDDVGHGRYRLRGTIRYPRSA